MSDAKAMESHSKGKSGLKAPLLPFILITSLFFMWGLANNFTDTLLAVFKRIMSMEGWREAKFGLFIHWGPYAVPAGVHDG